LLLLLPHYLEIINNVTRRQKEKIKTSNKLISGLFFVAGLVILISIGVSLGKETYRKRQVQKEIENLQSQIKRLDQENGELNNLIAYFSTSQFQEKEAREKLNLQKNNEQMIILRKDLAAKNQLQPEKEPAPVADDDRSPNWRKWLNFFFAPRDNPK
jgi:cell division protein FtsL